jgi:hypothetical protein
MRANEENGSRHSSYSSSFINYPPSTRAARYEKRRHTVGMKSTITA